MSYCKKCGTELAEGAKFCQNCGHKVETDEKYYESNDQGPVIRDQKLPIEPIGGIIFVILTIWNLGSMISMGYFDLWWVLEMVGYALFAAALFYRTKYPVFPVAIGLESICCLGVIIRGLIGGYYSVERYSFYSFSESSHFNLLCLLPDLARFLAALAACFAVVVLSTKLLEKYRGIVSNLWFAPLIAQGAAIILDIIVSFAFCRINIFGIYWAYGWYSFGMFVREILFTAGLAAVLVTVRYPEGITQKTAAYADPDEDGGDFRESSAAAGQKTTVGQETAAGQEGATYYTQNRIMPEGYCSMVKHVLLLIFTFGIWQLIWIYRTTRFLNCVKQEPPRNPATKLLLCMFVPFYIVYWAYKHGKYIDILAAQKGIPSDIGVLCLVLEIFVPIVPPIIMQDKMNTIVGIFL